MLLRCCTLFILYSTLSGSCNAERASSLSYEKIVFIRRFIATART